MPSIAGTLYYPIYRVFIDGGGVGGPFWESLALVGLILPGTVLMAGLGALIGSGEFKFLARLAGRDCRLSAGRLDLLWLGWRFKKPLHRWSFLKKNKALLDKTEHALHQHSMFTILVGRFVGPTRPLVPMVAGMLDLPVAKFITAEYYRLPAVATVLLPAWDSGGPRRSIFQPECRAASLNGCCWRRRYFCGLVAGCAGGYGAAVKQPIV
ncbi:DedA family integral membrane protein [Escherichia coli]|uniref:DedA family integral membrane protein n=1 Tax=Escherichia coli TaxID=562 RepID=A0A376YIA9_ECOLX|nr:DedA family integral membrane protein [Escherichia coli]